MTMTSNNKALVTRAAGDKVGLSLEPAKLDITDSQVLIRCESVAQNPTDIQCYDSNAFGDGAVLGCDFCGTVKSVGKNVTRVSVGDRVAGLVWGGEVKGVGAYSEYSIAEEDICFKVPLSITSDQAATVPLAATTAYLALFSNRCLNIPRKASSTDYILVWGGSSSVGLYTLQLAKAFSIPVATTCSPKHADLCRRMGATHVFDCRDPDVVDKIKSNVPNISHVFDCIGSSTSSIQASKTVKADGGTLCTVRPGKAFTEGIAGHVKITDVLVWTCFLKDHQYKEFKWPASREDQSLAIELFESIPKWLVSGVLVPNTPYVVPGGFEGVPKGFQMYRDNKISGFKIVYNL